jgi:predicted SAM-dependent methyltransferase
VRLEIGSGEFPDGGYEIHVDILALPAVAVVCAMDRLPFRDGSFAGLRANHVLEHQSYELVDDTVVEWLRVLAPDASVDIGVPDARCRAESWVRGEITTVEANYWLLGGHSDRPAHRANNALGGAPRWLYNAHHTFFDPTSLRDLLEKCGLVDIDVRPEDTCNMRARAHLPAWPGEMARR